MKVSYKLSQEEFLEGQRAYCSRLASKLVRFSFRFAVPVAVLLLADGIAVFVLHLNSVIALILAVWGVWMLINRTVIWPIRMKKEYAQYPDMERTMEFGDEGMAAQTNFGKSELRWSRLTRFAETDGLFVLFAPPRFLYTVPKRAFAAGELDAFRRLLQQKISVH
jgi:YcxB-like protein